jgi:hypothetical protein
MASSGFSSGVFFSSCESREHGQGCAAEVFTDCLIKGTLNGSKGLDKPSLLVDFTAGGTAGLLCCPLIYPFDVVKTRMQIASSEAKFLSVRQTALHIYQTAGMRGFYVGLRPTLACSFAGSAGAMVCLEAVLRLFRSFEG